MSVVAGFNPIQFAEASHVVWLGNVPSPGVIMVNGIEGFHRKTDWDKKKGKGAKGATSTVVQEPPAEGSFTFLLWEPQHWDEWAAFIPLLKISPDKSNVQGISIYHPSIADLGISSVVVDEVGPILHRGRAMYTRKLYLHEWQSPPAVSIVQTPKYVNTNAAPKPPGDTPDPAVLEAQKQAEQLLHQAGIP
jgi:hypothetical protein